MEPIIELEKEKEVEVDIDPQIDEVDARFQLCKSIAEECITDDELRLLLKNKPHPVCYDGFEPGRMHIAQGLMKTQIVNKLTKAGCTYIFWIADWFALLNNKLDGNLERIQTAGKYMIEVWKACGMDMTHVQFLWASEEINKNPNQYWLIVMDIARRFNVPRIKRCSKIMGRNDEENMPCAQILYPLLQCADIFFLKVDICQLGQDQRKVNTLAREYCELTKRKFKPIVLSHHMLSGLLEGQEKMSKSDPDSAIFMEDDESEVNHKIKKAFCPPLIVKGNPCLDYMKHIVFPKFETLTMMVNGVEKTYANYEELEADYISGALHPSDLKPTLTKCLNLLIQPIRDHFETNADAKLLLEKVKKFKVTK